jgi:hypothetical protein
MTPMQALRKSSNIFSEVNLYRCVVALKLLLNLIKDIFRLLGLNHKSSSKIQYRAIDP